jgi:hypothetical protein
MAMMVRWCLFEGSLDQAIGVAAIGRRTETANERGRPHPPDLVVCDHGKSDLLI